MHSSKFSCLLPPVVSDTQIVALERESMASKRAPYNRHVDIWTGPAGLPPSTRYRTGVIARWVNDSRWFTSGGLRAFATGYLTMPAPPPSVSLSAGVSITICYNTATADQVALTTLTPPDYWVVDVDWMLYPTMELYMRVWLAPLPLP
jgi:hypothetical protein